MKLVHNIMLSTFFNLIQSFVFRYLNFCAVTQEIKVCKLFEIAQFSFYRILHLNYNIKLFWNFSCEF